MKRSVIGIDPGPERSAMVLLPWDIALVSRGTVDHWYDTNSEIRERLRDAVPVGSLLAIEFPQFMGMDMGSTFLDMAFWCGRFAEAYEGEHVLIHPTEVRSHVCHDTRAKGPNIRAALIERFGPGKDKAIGTKKLGYGPMHGLVGQHRIDALAVAVTAFDRMGDA